MPLTPLTIPTPQDIELVRRQHPIHAYDHHDVERYLRHLQDTYPTSRLVVSTTVDIIETSYHDGSRHLIHGHLAILEHVDALNTPRHFQLDLLGGATGHEGFYVPASYATIDWGNSGWSACAGTPGSWNASYVPAYSMMAVGVQFLARVLSGDRLNFPAPLTPEERRQRLADGKRHLLARLRLQTAAQDPTFPLTN